MADHPLEDLISLAEACKLIPSRKPGKRLCLSTLWRWCADGKVRSWRIGGSWFVSREEMMHLAEPRPDRTFEAGCRVRRMDTARILREAGIG